MKVYAGKWMVGAMPYRVIIAAKSRKEVADTMDITINDVRNYWTITTDKDEVTMALDKPRVPIFRRLDSRPIE